MPINCDIWLNQYLKKLKLLFGIRVVFVGLQGSYGRGEATEDSDIDVVVILNKVNAEDLKLYRNMLDSLEYREKICGFISGIKELNNWERSDLFQFYYDTIPIYGSIDFIKDLISSEDVKRAIRISACNLYHMCGHNMIHEKSTELLQNLYKSATFTVQAIFYLETGTYIKRKTELIKVLLQPELKIIKTAINIKNQPVLSENEFDNLSKQLLNWSSNLISTFHLA